MFLQYCWLLLLHGSESDKLLVNERDSECHEVVVCDSEVQKDDEVSEARLVGKFDELDEMGEVDYEEVSEVRKADE